MAIESLQERASDANNAMIDCDRKVRMLEGALQRHKDQPCQKTNANAGTGGDHTMASSESLTVSHRERGATSATAKSGDQSAPPSEPNLVQTARELARFGMNAAAETNQACVAYIDTLSARLKRAEELLQEIFDYRSIQIGREIGWKITAFLAGKGEA